jgi:uncharacterized protein with HEPN domain
VSSNRPELRLKDIVENIARIDRHLTGVHRADFLDDEKTVNAIERCLERISEAARKLRDKYDAVYPAVGWPELRKLGSVLRHDYDVVDRAELWRTLKVRIPPLKRACISELAKLGEK